MSPLLIWILAFGLGVIYGYQWGRQAEVNERAGLNKPLDLS